MKLTTVKNEQAVTRILTCCRVLERYLSSTHRVIQHDMCPIDASNMICLKRWHEKSGDGAFNFKITFHLELKRGWTVWTATCALHPDFYTIKVVDVSFCLTKFTMPRLFDFGVECWFGFVAFTAVPMDFHAIDLLKGYVDQVNDLVDSISNTYADARCQSAKASQLETELEDLKQQLADIYWTTQN